MSLVSNIRKAFREPRKFKRYAGVLIRSIPFRLRLTKLVPGYLHLSHIPERYVTHLDTYQNEIRSPINYALDKGNWTKRNYANNAGDMTRYYFLRLTCDQIIKEGLWGDVAELGVYRGNSAYLLANLARHLDTTAYLFDTFKSFDGKDLVGDDENVKQDPFKETSKEIVKSVVGEDNVRFIEGYFPDSLEQLESDPRFCLVHIDCDLYQPTKAALDYFYPRLVNGGWLIMHDYSSYVWRGVEKAIDEFFADKPERLILVPDRSGTAVIRRMGST